MGLHEPILDADWAALPADRPVTGPRILLVVGGGIAAYKSCELVRLIRRAGGTVTCVLTEGGQQFVTPMALAALSENKVYTSLFDLKDEVEMGHIRLSRDADCIVVCPATADLMAKMAAGIADDLATTLILATDKPVFAVPAMNVRMWEAATTQRNAEWLRQAGVHVMDPDEGPMACGEFGPGRLPEPAAILHALADALALPLDLPEPAVPQLAAPAPEEPEAEWSEPEAEPAPYVVEALEPEDSREVARSGGGLGGLLSLMIPRSTRKRSQLEIAQDWEEPLPGPEPEPEWDADAPPEPDGFGAPVFDEYNPNAPADDSFVVDDLAPADPAGFADADTQPDPFASPDFAPAPAPAPAGFASLLAVKGRANAAPPTDPDAINHEVARLDRRALPQPFADEVVHGAAPLPAGLADPLDGQPEFDADPEHRPLYGRHVLVTAGPTREPIDPVRYIANRSSGKQGFAIAAMAAAAGARVTLVSGPVHLPTPPGVDRIDVETAEDMAEEVRRALPADAAFMVAAVADWRSRHVAAEKMKKRGSAPPALILAENPDILAAVAAGRQRPPLLIGFAAETENVLENAKVKRKRKGADWIVANNVAEIAGQSVMGGDMNQVHIVTADGVESLPEMAKEDVARELVRRAAEALAPVAEAHD